MLKEAYYETKNKFQTTDLEKIPRNYGFKTIQDAIAVYYNVPLDTANKYPIEHFVIKKSNKINTKKKPNVVLILVESWSNHLINFNDSQMDLLCSMKKHMDEDVLFRNFQSSGNGTLASLEKLIVNSPYNPLFDTKYRFVAYPTSIAWPFKQADYETKFITGLELSWRHLNEALPIQFFDKAMGKFNILKSDPNAKSNSTWGVYDHHVLDFIFSQLHENNNKKPQFIMCLTSTSHTPFELPNDYPMPKLNITKKVQRKFSLPADVAINYLRGYQYSNKALGDFLNKIKNSDLAENTIVIITGDHNVRSLITYDNKFDIKYKNSVPLYLYIPKEYKKNIDIDTSIYGAHNDIISTIVPQFLSEVKYYNLGQNLFDKNANRKKNISINDSHLIYGDSINSVDAEFKQNASRAISAYYFSRMLNFVDNKKKINFN